ncbi:hypothetical protein ALC57_10310 [Trachymyrmex cornetzi]|uniref:Uncharacterized protein n=1 Tax=Trachymyrmex cornetzi TaxID=471704 RepID=A0A151J487_9HYME|nr:hypothetical protein ALC57_10310 [Trachymyrmex cornetzi]
MDAISEDTSFHDPISVRQTTAVHNSFRICEIARTITRLYNVFEKHNDELAITDPNDAHQDEFVSIQERFYQRDNCEDPANQIT